jgi:hypothetical protein
LWSEGKTGFNITSQKLNAALGNPTSKLTYQGMQGNSAELFLRDEWRQHLRQGFRRQRASASACSAT